MTPAETESRLGTWSESSLRVRYCETDAMGIVHHAAYLPYLEEARVAWLRSIGHAYDTIRAEGVDFGVLGKDESLGRLGDQIPQPG